MRIRNNLGTVLALWLALLAPASLGSLACEQGPFEEAGEEVDETTDEAEEEAEDTFDN